MHEQVSTRHIDLVGEGQGHCVPCRGALDGAVEGDDLLDPRLTPGPHHQHRVARLHRPRSNGPGKAAEIGVGAIDPLHRKTEGLLAGVCRRIHGFEMGEQAGSAVPRRARRRLDHIVAITRRDRDHRQRGKAEIGGKAAVFLGDSIEHGLVELDQIELVDSEHDVTNAEQRADQRVPPRLRQQPLACVDEQNREFGIGGAGHHVARVLLVPGRVGDDEGAARRREKPVGDVDRDSLLPLVFQTVQQQREIDVVAGRAEAARLAPEAFELVVEDQLRVVKQAADQGRFTVIDRAAGQETQQAPIGEGGHRPSIVGHQK